MLNNRIFFILAILSIGLVQSGLAQSTSQWRLLWDANTEDDMAYYKIFKDTNSQPTTQIGTINHPDTEYIDQNLVPGTRYYYRIKAVDETELESDFSDVVSAAIPNVTNIPNRVVNQGQSFPVINLNNYVTDPDYADSEIQWTYSGNSELTVSINNNQATISAPSANWHGNETITFTGTDPDEFFDQDAANFEVNALPVTTSVPNQLVNQGQDFVTINLDNYVADPDNADNEITWTTSGNSELTVTINSNRVATITAPNSNWYGSETITFTATDPHDASANSSAQFTVNATPNISNIPDQNINQGENFTTINLDSYVSDSDNDDDEITWSFSGNSQLSVSINSNRVATISVPSPNWYGDETITFRATDPNAAFRTNSATFSVNGAPQITRNSIPDLKINQGEEFDNFDLDDIVSDPDNSDDELTWSSNGNEKLQVDIDNNNIATITSTDQGWYGFETITFVVSDPGGLKDSTQSAFTIVGMSSPVVNNIPNQLVNEGAVFESITLDDFVTDPESDDAELTWTYSGNKELDIDISEDRIATITPPFENWVGVDTIIFVATDPEGNFDSDLTIFSINGAPALSSMPTQSINQGENFTAITLDDYVTDPNNLNNELNWTFSGNQNLQVNITGNRIALVQPPNPQWSGEENITFIVTDPGSLQDSTTCNFKITGMAAPLVTDIPDQLVEEDEGFVSINLDEFVNDSESDDSEIDWSYSQDDEVSISIDENRIAQITKPTENWFGSDTVLFTATDPQNNSNSDYVIFTSNSVPNLSSIPDQTVNLGQNFDAINLNNYVSDFNNDYPELNWEISGNSELLYSLNNRLITITPISTQWIGSETFIFIVSDPYGASDTSQAVYTVVTSEGSTIELLSFQGQTISQGEQFEPIELDQYVNCDNQLKPQLTWTCSGNVNLIVEISSDRVANVNPIDDNWSGSEELLFRVTSPSGLWFEKSAVFSINQNIFSALNYQFVGSGTIIEFHWQTLIPVKSQIIFGQNKTDLSTDLGPKYSNEHNHVVSGLTPNSLYYFHAFGIDSSGTEYFSSVYEIETKSEGEINVFPNPYRAGEYVENDVVNFANLPQGSSVYIYNLLGEPVFSKDEINNLFRWNAVNDHNEEVQAGLYIYVVKGSDNKKLTSGKLVIIR